MIRFWLTIEERVKIYTQKRIDKEENEVVGKLWWGKRVENDSVQTRI